MKANGRHHDDSTKARAVAMNRHERRAANAVLRDPEAAEDLLDDQARGRAIWESY